MYEVGDEVYHHHFSDITTVEHLSRALGYIRSIKPATITGWKRTQTHEDFSGIVYYTLEDEWAKYSERELYSTRDDLFKALLIVAQEMETKLLDVVAKIKEERFNV